MFTDTLFQINLNWTLDLLSGRLLLSQAFAQLIDSPMSKLENLYEHLEPSSATRLRVWFSELSQESQPSEVPLSFKNHSPSAYIALLEPLFYKGELNAVQGRMLPLLSMFRDQILTDLDKSSSQGNIGIVLTDPLGRICDCNLLFCEMLGINRSALLGSKIQAFIHPADLTHPLALYSQFRDGNIETMHMEKRYRQADGDFFNAEVAITLVRENGNINHCIRFILNLSKHKQLQSEHKLQKQLIGDLEINQCLPDVSSAD